MLNITVPITTRAEMNTSTPRFGSWTYHHVLPVRVYYLAASTILRVIIEPDCWKDTRTLGLLALRSMCQYRANEEKIALFLQNRKWLHTRPSHAGAPPARSPPPSRLAPARSCRPFPRLGAGGLAGRSGQYCGRG